MRLSRGLQVDNLEQMGDIDAIMKVRQKGFMMAKAAKILDDSAGVNAYMRDLDHPFKAEVEAVRGIILGVHPQITEGIKWNAPCFYYKGDMAVFNLHSKNARDHVHLIFPSGTQIADVHGLFEGNYPDGRRMAYFKSMDDVTAKQPLLEQAVRAWIELKDKQPA